MDSFKLSNPVIVGKVRHVIGHDFNPPEAVMVLCVDEKTQIQALDRTAATPAASGASRVAHPRPRERWHHYRSTPASMSPRVR